MVVPVVVRAWRNCWQVMQTIKDRLGRSWLDSISRQRLVDASAMLPDFNTSVLLALFVGVKGRRGAMGPWLIRPPRSSSIWM